MSKNKTTKRLGIFYRSNGRWTGPYQGYTFTPYSATRNPVKEDIAFFKNKVLKSRVKILPVG